SVANGLKGKETEHIVRYLSVFAFPDSRYYGILQEKLTKLSYAETSAFDEMGYAFTNALRLHYGRVLQDLPWDGFVEKIRSSNHERAIRALEVANKFQMPEMVTELRKNQIYYQDWHAD